ncbi:MAG: HAMP domain-containing histidine kinase [Anaeroplasmataceae bacterium]|nr:HAMP domain-containing histidine kinase [Anaeroplasmataceae bacterium]
MLSVHVDLLLWIFIPLIGFLTLCIILLIVILTIQKRRKKREQENYDYFSKIIHDLKTPIYAIDGYTLLASKSLNQLDKTEEYLNKISSISRHMLALVKDVTDLSKIKDGKLDMNITIGNMDEIITQCLDNVEPQILRRKIYFEKHIKLIHNKVLVDDLHLIQILTNLLSNAIKYTEAEGKIFFTILEQPRNEETSTYIFSIKDTGYGMSEEFQKHLFEPFAQERALAHTDVESSGLGLFIVKKLIDKMHGTIEVESKPNEGSCFTIAINLDIVGSNK